MTIDVTVRWLPLNDRHGETPRDGQCDDCDGRDGQMQMFTTCRAAPSLETREDVMGREHRERKPGKARRRSTSLTLFRTSSAIVEVAVPLGFEEPTATLGLGGG